MSKENVIPRYLPESERSQFISLKEAAHIVGYSPDYIGQLIRAGKIEGQQVYTNVSWVTTEDAVRAYMHSKGKSEESAPATPFWKEPMFFIRYALYAVILCLGCILLVLCYIFFTGIDHAMTNANLNNFDIHAYGL